MEVFPTEPRVLIEWIAEQLQDCAHCGRVDLPRDPRALRSRPVAHVTPLGKPCGNRLNCSLHPVLGPAWLERMLAEADLDG